MSSRISEVFARLKSKNQMAFMPFITAGDPDLSTTGAVIEVLAQRGVDLIEIGFPYSDPIADGPVIQASYTRALSRGFQINDLLEMVKGLTRGSTELPPLVGMVSYAIVFRSGLRHFVSLAKDAGLSGLIIPDLPADEAGEMSQVSADAGIDLIQLIAPTTTQARTKRILDTAKGFLYCISIAGTTGVRDQLPEELKSQLAWLQSQTELPLAVGFGISRPEQVHGLRGLADGVIVGSAIVRLMSEIGEEGSAKAEILSRIGDLAEGFLKATRQI